MKERRRGGVVWGLGFVVVKNRTEDGAAIKERIRKRFLLYSRIVRDAVIVDERGFGVACGCRTTWGTFAVAVYMYTLHAYRSWMPDHERGYVRRGKGIFKRDEERARWYHSLAKHERMVFDDTTCEQIIEAIHDLAEKHRWRVHAIAVVWTHVHVVVSWRSFFDAQRGRAVLKRGISVWLRDKRRQKRKWLARGGGIKRVRDRGHLDRLTKRYLPSHRRYGGRQWCEGV